MDINFVSQKLLYDDIIRRGSLLIDDKGKKYYLKEGYFDTEAFKTISKFKPPHTAHILDYSRNYLLSEYVEGTFLNGAVLSEQELYPLLIKICEAISELHRIGIIHLDIKPSDFVIDSNGQVIIKDFESVRSIPNGYPVEVWFNGTDSYSPPEQYNVIYVDGRADVYSFGQTVDALNRRYDPGLYKVIKNCTAELPWERYQSIEDVKADLINICKRKFRSIIK